MILECSVDGSKEGLTNLKVNNSYIWNVMYSHRRCA